MGGHFNKILYAFEKGGVPRAKSHMQEFRRVLEDFHLVDIGFSSSRFTWERRNLPEMNIRERLDRGVANDSWLDLFPNYRLYYVIHSTSYHCLILILNDSRQIHRDVSRFRFEM